MKHSRLIRWKMDGMEARQFRNKEYKTRGGELGWGKPRVVLWFFRGLASDRLASQVKAQLNLARHTLTSETPLRGSPNSEGVGRPPNPACLAPFSTACLVRLMHRLLIGETSEDLTVPEREPSLTRLQGLQRDIPAEKRSIGVSSTVLECIGQGKSDG